MNNYLADTMAIVLYLERRRLPSNVKTIFNNANDELTTIYFSTVSLMEIGYLSEKSRIDISLPDVIKLTNQSKNFCVYDLGQEAVIAAFKIKNIPELHDRLITASALVLDADLITNDPVIIKSGQVKTVWHQ